MSDQHTTFQDPTCQPIYTQTCSNMIFDASGKYTRHLKQEVFKAHPFKTLPAKIDKNTFDKVCYRDFDV